MNDSSGDTLLRTYSMC